MVVIFRIITRESWRELHRWQEALPGSRIEHIMYSIYALTVEPGGAGELAA
jgi:hypothetical protein